MKIRIERAGLASALAALAGTIGRANTPIMEHVLIATEGDGTVTLTGSNFDRWHRVTRDCSIERAGAVALPFATLRPLVERLSQGAEVEIDAAEPGRAQVRAGRSSARMGSMSPDDYPPFPGSSTERVQIGGDLLSWFFEMVGFAAASDSAMYYLNGMLLHSERRGEKNFLCAAATDSHKLAVAERPLEGEAASFDLRPIIVPRDSFAAIKSLMQRADGEPIGFAASDGTLDLMIARERLATRLLDATYPAYRQMFPKGAGRRVIPGAPFREALKRATLFGSLGRKDNLISFVFEGGSIALAAAPEPSASRKRSTRRAATIIRSRSTASISARSWKCWTPRRSRSAGMIRAAGICSCRCRPMAAAWSSAPSRRRQPKRRRRRRSRGFGQAKDRRHRAAAGRTTRHYRRARRKRLGHRDPAGRHAGPQQRRQFGAAARLPDRAAQHRPDARRHRAAAARDRQAGGCLMDPVAALDLRYDGPIPPSELRMARLEKARALVDEIRRRHCVIRRVRLKPAGIVARMASDILDVAGTAGCCTEEDLRSRGWSARDIANHGEAARDMAGQRAVRRARRA
jgi:DNA polymerase-3 subunit beta